MSDDAQIEAEKNLFQETQRLAWRNRAERLTYGGLEEREFQMHRTGGPKPVEVLPEVEKLSPKWYLAIESMEGQWPRCEPFDTPEDLARRLKELDGEDLTVFAFYGILLPFSSGPWRYLFLPDNRILQSEKGVVETVPFDRVSPLAAAQEDGYLGPDILREGMSKQELAKLATPKKKRESWKPAVTETEDTPTEE